MSYGCSISIFSKNIDWKHRVYTIHNNYFHENGVCLGATQRSKQSAYQPLLWKYYGDCRVSTRTMYLHNSGLITPKAAYNFLCWFNQAETARNSLEIYLYTHTHSRIAYCFQNICSHGRQCLFFFNLFLSWCVHTRILHRLAKVVKRFRKSIKLVPTVYMLL